MLYNILNILNMSEKPFIKINDIKIITSSSYITKHNTDCIICRQSINNDSIYSKKGIY